MDTFVQSYKERQSKYNQINSLFASSIQSNTNKSIRKLTLEEINILKENNKYFNTTDISISYPSTTTDACIKSYINNIKNNNFSGTILFLISSNKTTVLPQGIYNNTLIQNCIIDLSSCIYNNTIIQNTYIGSHVCVLDCCEISCDDSSNGINVTLGAESGGGRMIKVYPESTLLHICTALGFLSNAKAPKFTPFSIDKAWNIIESNCTIAKCTTIKNVHCMSNCTIKDCSINNLIALSSCTITSSKIKDTYCQWNTTISSSNVSESQCMEYSAIGPNSYIHSSIIGPDTHVSNGEIHNSLLGSNVASHHQSLLISTFIPNGRCNIGYGSNIGSNHTSRSPDQEIFVGEGIFFGLDCSIKFPINLVSCPYSIIATSVKLPSYYMLENMPFSLLLNNQGGGDGVSVLPAWVIQYSPYTIERNERKYATRNKAKRHSFYLSYSIYRMDIVELCITGRDILSSYQQSSSKNTGISKIGIKNGILYYTEFIQRFALAGLYSHVKQLYDVWKKSDTPPIDSFTTIQQHFPNHTVIIPSSSQKNNLNNLFIPFANHPNNKQNNTISNYQIQILTQEFNDTKISSLLKAYTELETNYTNRIKLSKLKDEVRGKKVIPFYELGHDDTLDDVVIGNSLRRLEEKEKFIDVMFKEWFYDGLKSRL